MRVEGWSTSSCEVREGMLQAMELYQSEGQWTSEFKHVTLGVGLVSGGAIQRWNYAAVSIKFSSYSPYA